MISQILCPAFTFKKLVEDKIKNINHKHKTYNSLEIISLSIKPFLEGHEEIMERKIYIAPSKPQFQTPKLNQIIRNLEVEFSQIRQETMEFEYFYNYLLRSTIFIGNRDNNLQYQIDNIISLHKEPYKSLNKLLIYPTIEIAKEAQRRDNDLNEEELIQMNFDFLKKYGFDPNKHLTFNEKFFQEEKRREEELLDQKKEKRAQGKLLQFPTQKQ